MQVQIQSRHGWSPGQVTQYVLGVAFDPVDRDRDGTVGWMPRAPPAFAVCRMSPMIPTT